MKVSSARWRSWQLAEYRRYGRCHRCGQVGHCRGAGPSRVYCLHCIPLRRPRKVLA